MMKLPPKLNSDFIYILILFLVVFTMYFPAIGMGFFSDDYVWLARYISLGFSGIPENYGDSFFLPLTHLISVAGIKLLGVNAVFFRIMSLVSLVFTGFFISKIFIQIIKSKNNLFFNYFPGIAFVLIPYNTEAVNWFAAFSYMLSAFFFVLSVYLYLQFRLSNRKRSFYLSLLFYFLSISSKEIALVFPAVIFVVDVFYFRKNFLNKFFLFSVGMTIVYFILRVLSIDALLGGYFGDKPLEFNFGLLLFNALAYFIKFFTMYRYIPAELKFFAKSHMFLFAGAALLIFGILIYRIIKKKQMHHLKILFIFLLLFFVSLVPVINLETSFLGEVQSDRYGYLPGIFFVLFISYLQSVFKSVFIRLTTGLILLAFFAVSLFQTNMLWAKADDFKENLITGIRKNAGFNKNNVLINLPDNYFGIYIFRNGFSKMLELNKIPDVNILFLQIVKTSENLLVVKKNVENTIEINFSENAPVIEVKDKFKQAYYKESLLILNNMRTDENYLYINPKGQVAKL